MHRQSLAAGGRRPGEHHRLAPAAFLFQDLEHRPVVQVGVEVVHPLGGGTVEVGDVEWNALPEVGLERVRSLVQQRAQLRLEPPLRLGVGEVDERHAGLPHVPLPDGAVGAPEKEAVPGGLGEQRRALADVGD
ncbi:hypothetical protein GCM10023259_005260 [Thermocatellispora tengchongensis]